MSRDPIVEDVRQARGKLLDECRGDLDALLDRLKAAEDADRDTVISRQVLDRKRQKEPMPSSPASSRKKGLKPRTAM